MPEATIAACVSSAFDELRTFEVRYRLSGLAIAYDDVATPILHALFDTLVALGTTLSAFWILALNSWMQTPAGYEVRVLEAWTGFPTDDVAADTALMNERLRP